MKLRYRAFACALFPRIRLVTVLLSVLVACSQSDASLTQSNQSKYSLAIPDVISAASLPSVCIASITIDGQPRQFMPIIDAHARYLFNDFELGNHRFNVEFSCEVNNGVVQLVSATKYQELVNGPNSVSFEDVDFIPLPDTDGDNVSNLRELELKTNPLIGNLPPAPVLTVNGSGQLIQFTWDSNEWATHSNLLLNKDGASGFTPIVSDIVVTVHDLKFTAYSIDQLLEFEILD